MQTIFAVRLKESEKKTTNNKGMTFYLSWKDACVSL